MLMCYPKILYKRSKSTERKVSHCLVLPKMKFAIFALCFVTAAVYSSVVQLQTSLQTKMDHKKCKECYTDMAKVSRIWEQENAEEQKKTERLVKKFEQNSEDAPESADGFGKIP